MNWKTAGVNWETVYAAIRADFGFEHRADERARDVLDGLLDERCSLQRLSVLRDTAVTVVAPGPSLTETLQKEPIGTGPLEAAETVVAVSDAVGVLRDRNVTIDCHVTDLDGAPLLARKVAEDGVPVVVHAHGDNIPAIRRHIPKFRQDRVVPTAQVPPAGQIDAPGGFTDGDRAAVLADRMGAQELQFIGWDLTDRSLEESKRRKLEWAGRILTRLERRRGEHYAPLEGVRDSLAPLPDD